MQRASSQWEVLALARFVLAGHVLLWHLKGAFHDAGWPAVVELAQDGRSAVYGFLLISGYSIAASLDREASGFLWRRLRRIYPVYLLSLALALIVSAAGAGPPQTLLRFAGTALMLQTFAVSTISTDGQLWSVAIEWWNYMLAPLYRRMIDIGLWLLIALSLGLYLLFLPKDPSFMTGGIVFAQLSWMWLAGFLYYRRRRTLSGYAVLAGPLVIAAVFSQVWLTVWLGVLALAICEVVTVPSRLVAALRWLGDLSYPVYALHVPVFALCLRFDLRSPAVIMAAVLASACVALHVVDLPARRLRLPGPAARTANMAAPAEA